MVKLYYFLIAFYFMLHLQGVTQSQTDWVYVGNFENDEVYYIKSSVLRGDNTFVIVVLKPMFNGFDEEGKEFEYLTLKCIFYKDYRNEVKCLVSNRIFHYKDNTYRKSVFPNLELSLNFDRVLYDLYNKIK